MVGVYTFVETKRNFALIFWAGEIAPEGVVVPSFEAANWSILGSQLTESACRINEERRFNRCRRLAVKLALGNFNFVILQTALNVGGTKINLSSMVYIDTIPLGQKCEEKVADRPLDLETAQKETRRAVAGKSV